jgi:hypothetical protein
MFRDDCGGHLTKENIFTQQTNELYV